MRRLLLAMALASTLAACASLRYPPCPPPDSASGLCTLEDDKGQVYYIGPPMGLPDTAPTFCRCSRSYYHPG